MKVKLSVTYLNYHVLPDLFLNSLGVTMFLVLGRIKHVQRHPHPRSQSIYKTQERISGVGPVGRMTEIQKKKKVS